jgi:hypothetical protein
VIATASLTAAMSHRLFSSQLWDMKKERVIKKLTELTSWTMCKTGSQ